jgi:hypothetical protein
VKIGRRKSTGWLRHRASAQPSASGAKPGCFAPGEIEASSVKTANARTLVALEKDATAKSFFLIASKAAAAAKKSE